MNYFSYVFFIFTVSNLSYQQNLWAQTDATIIECDVIESADSNGPTLHQLIRQKCGDKVEDSRGKILRIHDLDIELLTKHSDCNEQLLWKRASSNQAVKPHAHKYKLIFNTENSNKKNRTCFISELNQKCPEGYVEINISSIARSLCKMNPKATEAPSQPSTSKQRQPGRK